jgi:hypothetical protein
MFARKLLIRTIITLIVSVVLVSTALAQDTLLISYQGRLTDNSGDPITGSHALTITIYDGSGVSKWSESHSAVQVDNGLFNVILGSQTALPKSVFDGEDRFLGISIDGDDEIVPRTLLTSSPGAAYSRQLVGDVATGPGILRVKSVADDSAIVLVAVDGLNAAILHPPDPCVPPDPCEPALEMVAEPDKNIIRVHPPEPCVPPEPCDPALELIAEADANKLTIEPPPSGESGIIMESSANKCEIGIASTLDHLREFSFSKDNLMAANVMAIRSPGRTGGFDANIYPIGAFVADSKSAMNLDYVMPTDGESSAIKLEVEALKSFIELRYNDEFGETDPHEIKMVAATDTGLILVGGPPPDDGIPSVVLKSTTEMASIVLEGNDPTGAPPQVAIMAGTDDARIGIGTDVPEKPLDVKGTAQVEGFKMPTDASDGHVLTSDADGNGTWQAPALTMKALTGATNETTHGVSGKVTVWFNLGHTNEFSSPPVIFVEACDPSNGLTKHGEVTTSTLAYFEVQIKESVGGALVLGQGIDVRYMAVGQ